MSSLATVILSPCSWAISSSTGATILHGPHQVAQKSTTTGLSLFSTSSENVASVTLIGLPMGAPLGRNGSGRSGRRDGVELGGELGAGAGLRRGVRNGRRRVLGQPALGVDRGRAAAAGSGDGLLVGLVGEV